MNIKRILFYLSMCSLAVLLEPVQGLPRQNSDAAKTGPQQAVALRDGQHDFDFELGTWKIHLKRLVHPLTGSTTWVEFDGTSVTRKVWDGRANLEEFETDSPVGAHIEGLTLRLYDPQTHQWSLYWATSKSGTMGPPTIGEFKDGRGEFTTRNHLALMAEPFWFDLFGRRPTRIRRTSNSRSRKMEGRPGKSTGSRTRRG